MDPAPEGAIEYRRLIAASLFRLAAARSSRFSVLNEVPDQPDKLKLELQTNSLLAPWAIFFRPSG